MASGIFYDVPSEVDNPGTLSILSLLEQGVEIKIMWCQCGGSLGLDVLYR